VLRAAVFFSSFVAQGSNNRLVSDAGAPRRILNRGG